MTENAIADERCPSLSDLAPVFVPLLVERMRDAKVVFRNGESELSDDQLAEACAFFVSEQPRNPYCDQRIWLAERYGGDEIANNGGGVRCGLAGDLQVKGIGPNLLLGRGSDEAHSNGHLSLGDAIYETLWSEILNEVLPYGGESVVAILRRSGTCAPHVSERALLVRQPNIRPAHFERAIHFKPIRDAAWHREADVQRVARLAPRLAACLPRAEGCPADQWRTLSDYQRFHYGLSELARRFAIQCAFGRSHLMAHGCTSSNVSIEGKLLDFTSVATLHASTYESAQKLKWAWKKVWSEHVPLVKSLSSICYYANRYWLHDGTRANQAREHSLQVFHREFDLRCTQYFLCLAGIPSFIARQIASHPFALDWIRLLISAVDSWVSTFSDAAPSDSHAAPLKHSLEGRMTWISFASFAGLARDEDDVRAPFSGAKDDLSEVYGRVLDLALQKAAEGDVSRVSFQRALLIGETRHLISGAYLNREVVKAEIADMLQMSSAPNCLKTSIDDFIRTRKCMALLAMKYDDGLNITLWNAGNYRIELDLRTDTLNIFDSDQVSSHPAAHLETLSRHNDAMKDMVARYGTDRLTRIASIAC